MKRPFLMFLSVVVLDAGWLQPAVMYAQSDSYQSYLAHIAAANASLRLNEAAEAKRWIAGAPEEHRGWEWQYLNARAENSIRSIDCGDATPGEIRLSHDGSLLAAAMSDGSVRLFRTGDWTETGRLTGHTAAVYDARFSPDDRKLVSCSRDGSLRMWDISMQKQLWETKGGGAGLSSVAYSPDGVTVGYCSWYRKDGVRGTVALFDAERGEEVWRTDYDVKPIVDMEFSGDRKYFAVGTWNWRVVVWDARSRQIVRELDYNDIPSYSAIDDIAFSRDGKRIAATSKSSIPRVWEIETGKLVSELHGHTRPVFAVSFADDDSSVYTAGGEGAVMLWDVRPGTLMSRLYGHVGRVSSLAVMGGVVASSSDDGTIRIWDTKYGRQFTDRGGRSESIYAFPLSRDGALLATSGPGGTITIWDAAGGTVVRNFPGLNDGVINAADFSPDGSLLAACDWDNVVKIWDVKTGQVKKEISPMEGGSSSVAFRPDGRHVASVSTEKAVVVWDVGTGELVKKLPLNAAPYDVTYSPDGTLIAAGVNDGTVSLWDGASFEVVRTISAHRGSVFSVAFTPDGRRLLTGGDDGQARLWDLQTGERIFQLQDHSQRVWSVAVSPDGKRFATGSADLTVRVWDTQTGRATLILSEFTDPVYNVMFSPDGSKLYANSAGKEIMVFDTVGWEKRRQTMKNGD